MNMNQRPQPARIRKGPQRLQWHRQPTLLQRMGKKILVLVICLITAAFIGGLAWGLIQAHKQAMSTAQPNQEASEPSPTPTATPALGIDGLVRFSDTVNNTSLAVQTDLTDPDVGVFTFETPTGAEYQGGQASDLQHHDGGKLGVLYDGLAQLIPPSTADPNALPTTVTVHFNATLDLNQQQATAELTDSTNSQSFSLATLVPAGESQAVQTYNQALINQDWATVYTLTSQTVTSVYTEAQFAQLMQQQVQTVGAITSITITSTPQVTIDTTAGDTSFTVNEQVTLTQGGSSQTQAATAKFVLEAGAWKYLTSQ